MVEKEYIPNPNQFISIITPTVVFFPRILMPQKCHQTISTRYIYLRRMEPPGGELLGQGSNGPEWEVTVVQAEVEGPKVRGGGEGGEAPRRIQR